MAAFFPLQNKMKFEHQTINDILINDNTDCSFLPKNYFQ
jgi:hypothetical protein